jgi:hypothetical protein
MEKGFPPIVLGKKERKRKKRNQKRKEGRNFHKQQKTRLCLVLPWLGLAQGLWLFKMQLSS